MKRWLAATMLLGMVCAAKAQAPEAACVAAGGGVCAGDEVPIERASNEEAASEVAATLDVAAESVPGGGGGAVPAAPMPRPSSSPTTRSRSGGDEGSYTQTWEMGLGYAFVKFRSSIFSANMSGLNSSVAYYVKHNIAVEANATTGFGAENTKTFDREHPKFLFYDGGLKYAEHGETWEPWVHVLGGGVHMIPQTALGSMSGFAIKAGGGVDRKWRDSRLSVRLEGNYIRTQLYSQGQNSVMIGVGLVIR